MSEAAFRAVCTGLSWGALGITVCIVGWTLQAGVGELGPGLLLEPARDAGRAGGLGSVLVSTAGVLAVALGLAVPVGLGAAVWLSEYAGPRGGPVRGALDLLATVPSIVHGLFGMALFCEALGLGWSLWAGGLTLGLMILPLFTRLAEEALRAVPDTWRRAGAAAGLDRWQLLGPVILPAALPGLVASLVLATGRALGESAALLFTAGTALRMPAGLDEPGRVLALHVYVMAVDVPGGQARAAAAALVLFAFASGSAALARLAPVWIARRTSRC